MPALILRDLRVGHPAMRILQQCCEDHEALLVESSPSAEATVQTPACATKKHARAPAEELLVRSLRIHARFRAAVCLTSNTAWYSMAHSAREG